MVIVLEIWSLDYTYKQQKDKHNIIMTRAGVEYWRNKGFPTDTVWSQGRV